MKPRNMKLYNKAKSRIYSKYKKHSAYRSGAVIKLYKKLGGTFVNDGKEKTLKRWFKEKWKDVNPNKTANSYPVYRPTKRINSRTPLTLREIDKKDLRKKSRIKQVIRGYKNLSPFKSNRRRRRSKK